MNRWALICACVILSSCTTKGGRSQDEQIDLARAIHFSGGVP